MKTAIISAMMILATSPAFAKSKCSEKAADAAIAHWADVPNPDPGLEYMLMSSEPEAPRSNVYIVKLALGENGETAEVDYKVTFGKYESCGDPKVEDMPLQEAKKHKK